MMVGYHHRCPSFLGFAGVLSAARLVRVLVRVPFIHANILLYFTIIGQIAITGASAGVLRYCNVSSGSLGSKRFRIP